MNNDTTYIPILRKKKPVCLCFDTARSLRYTIQLPSFIKTAISCFLSLLLFVILLTPGAYAADKKLYVFYPLTTRPQLVQEILKDNLKDVSVTVFGRFNDFNAKIEIDPPDMVLTKPALIKQMSEYAIIANAIRKGSSTETYVLLSIDTPLDMKSVTSEITIGAIDILGRNAMKAFIGQFFPVQPKLKRVTKIEDLLPLLSFTMANGVLIEEVFVDYFKRTSNLNFKVSPAVPAQCGILALGCSVTETKHKHTISETLKKGNKEINILFEVDTWK